jgi:hypothetical protein
MENRTAALPLLFAAFLGIGRVLQPPAAQPLPAQDTGKPTSAAPAAKKKADKPFPTGIHLVREHLQSHGTLGVPDSLPGLGVLIATLPDPTDSHLDWAFDADFEAIVRAYERAGYVMDRYWLPWTEKFDTLATADSGFVARRVREEYPGAVLFRRDTVPSGDGGAAPRAGAPAARPELQLLYIVGEIPSAGVHKAALRRALQERVQLLAKAPAADPVIRIVGPSLSGSARSLAVALRQWSAGTGRSEPVEILTGSATSPGNATLLGTIPRATFGATVHSDSLLTLALTRWVLCPLDVTDHGVAILRESGTTYGRGAVAEHQGIDCPGSRRTMHPDSFVVIPFPMNIASLRSQSESSAPRDAAAGSPDRRVELSLRDPERPTDRPPAASALTAPTLEVVLDEIEHAITSQRIRAVGILASDVRDKLFLAKELHRRLRDVQLFTFEANALYLVPENNSELRGMMVVSTYPLSLQTQWWTPGRLGPTRLTFSNEGAVGIHNAVLMQLGAGHLAADYALPLLATGTAPQAPPVWVSAVGRGMFLPVTVDTSSEPGYLRPMQGGAQLPRDPLTIQFFTVASLILLSALLLYAVRRLFPFRADAGAGPDDGTVLATAGECASREIMLDEVRWGSQNLHEYLYGTLRVLALLSGYVPIAVLTAASLFRRRPSGAGEGTEWRYLLLALMATVLLVSLWAAGRYALGAYVRFRAVLPLGARYAGAGWGRDRARKYFWWVEIAVRALVAAVGVSFFAGAMWLSVQIVRLAARPITFPLFVHRAGELDAGVSPLLPLLLAAAGFAAWCTWHERRIATLRVTTPFEAAWQTRGGAAPQSTAPTALPHLARESVEQVRARLFLVVPNPAGLALGAVIAVLAAVLTAQFSRTIDGAISLTAFDWLLRLGIVGSLVSTCWAVYRLLSVWRALDRVLMHVGQTPLGPAFRRLPERVAQLTRLTLWRPPSREVVEMVSAGQWRNLKQLYRLAKPDFEALEAAHPELALAEYMRSDAPPPLSRPRRRLAKGGDDSFLRLDRILAKLWETEPDDQVVEEIRAEALKKSPDMNTSVLIRRAFPGGVRLWLRAAEEFAAVQVVDYVEWVLQALRTLALFLFVTLLLTTALISSYPFQPQGIVKLVFLFVLLGTVGALLYVMTAMNRDDVLSLIANTDAGRLTWDRTFVVNAFAIGVVPLLTLISSEVPALRTVLFAWVQPILRGITGG